VTLGEGHPEPGATAPGEGSLLFDTVFFSETA
jgi:hypothetical protein